MNETHYEIVFIVSSKVEEKDVPKAVEKVKDLITEKGGKITYQEEMGRKKFAYPIEHQKHGFYQIYEFDLPNENLKTIQKELMLNKAEIIRFLIINKLPQTEAKKPPKKKLAEKVETVLSPEKQEVSDKKTASKKKKVSLDDLDKKLDELLDKEIIQ